MSLSTADLLKRASMVDAQARLSLLKPDPQLDHALTNSAANNLPAITISPLQGQYLALQCRLINAKSVLEIGTLGGYSTIWFARTGAEVTSIEIDPKHRDVALANTEGLKVEIILGAALDVLPRLAAEGRKFDFIFVDANWAEQWDYFEWATRLARGGGCIYVDNVIRELLESDNVGEGDESLVTKVGRMGTTVSATLVSTISSHKEKVDQRFDGFLLAMVKENQEE